MNDDEETPVDELVKQLKGENVAWRQGILRPDSKLLDEYVVSGYPTKIVIGKDGVIKFMDHFMTKKQLEELIASG